jgi:hypothetical protein
MKKQFAVIGGLVILAGSAFAGDEVSEKSFNELDTNKDGYLTQGEASVDETLIAHFVEVDTNLDGVVSMAEFDERSNETEEGE